MGDRVDLKMFCTISLFLLIANVSFSLATADKEEKCSCYNFCTKNFTTNSIHDVQKITACQRGCRFFTLVLHSSREPDHTKSLKNAKEGCLLCKHCKKHCRYHYYRQHYLPNSSGFVLPDLLCCPQPCGNWSEGWACSEGYLSPIEVSACKFGCSAFELTKELCNTVEIQTPQISYSFLIEESDILIHSGEPEPDDALTDPGLRKQIQKTLVAFLDSTPKIPEIRFKNLPVKTEKLSEISHSNFKCPKFYGLDSKFEFRNGKIIIGDLYLFVGVFLFVVICFLLGHVIDTKNLKNEFVESRLPKKHDFADREPLLRFKCKIIEGKGLPQKSDNFEPAEGEPDIKSDDISLIFDEEDLKKTKEPLDYSIKI